MIALLSRFAAWLWAAQPVLHRFDPAECRERQRQAAIVAAFNPQSPPASRRLFTQDGFQ
ncbi:hypothetical protein [Caulobacter sp. BP25]|uniref:hypothetical protein n=1 Tax=Caulobacter sp. BP25 TaxID=2048900 RepID=UPI0013748332|nr:hypothetical protein [Caulobacter sp. BP25]